MEVSASGENVSVVADAGITVIAAISTIIHKKIVVPFNKPFFKKESFTKEIRFSFPIFLTFSIFLIFKSFKEKVPPKKKKGEIFSFLCFFCLLTFYFINSGYSQRGLLHRSLSWCNHQFDIIRLDPRTLWSTSRCLLYH